MRRLLSLVLPLLAAACLTEPDDRELAQISEIEVPETLASTDTLVISFVWTFGGCDEGLGVSTLWSMERTTFSALIRKGERAQGVNCPDVQRLVTHRHIIPPSQRSDPYTLSFRQPSGVDGVRIVRTP